MSIGENVQKWTRYFLLFFSRRARATSMTQRRVENTRVHFWTFSPVSVKSRKTAQPLEVKLKWSNMKLQTKFGPNGPTFQPVPYNVNMMAMLVKKQGLEHATILTEIPHKSVLA